MIDYLLPRLAGLAVSWVMLFGAARAEAENEPVDNASSGATSLSFSASKLASANGTISGGDTDWYKVTNTGAYKTITFTFDYNRTDTESFHGLEIFDGSLASLNFQWTDDSDPFNTAVITVTDPAQSAVFYIAVRGTSGVATAYNLKIQATGGTTAGGGTPAVKCNPIDTWTVWYQQADSDFAAYSALGDYNFANAFYYYNKAIGDYLFHIGHCRNAEALYWFHIWVGVYHYYYFQIIPGTLSYYYLFIWYAYAYYYYYSTLGDTETANEQFDIFYTQAIGFL